MNLSKLKLNPDNPQLFDDLSKLKQSIKEFPKMMKLRPLVYDPLTGYVLGGNKRLICLRELEFKEIPDDWVRSADELTKEEKKRFIIADNVGFGEWDWEAIESDWNIEELKEWGLELPEFDIENKNEFDNHYSRKIESPVYLPNDKKPPIKSLVNLDKSKELIKKINNSKISKSEKDFLKFAAYRHNVFDYSLIADFYANSNKEVQKLMEDSALVIIDFNKAIDDGFVRLSEEIAEQYKNDKDED